MKKPRGWLKFDSLAKKLAGVPKAEVDAKVAQAKAAKLPSGRHRKTQSMRVSHATWLTVVGGDATKSLMHSDPATTRDHYIDPKIAMPNQPRLFPMGE